MTKLFGPSQKLFSVLWPLLTSHSSLLLCLVSDNAYSSAPVRPHGINQYSFLVYLPDLHIKVTVTFSPLYIISAKRILLSRIELKPSAAKEIYTQSSPKVKRITNPSLKITTSTLNLLIKCWVSWNRTLSGRMFCRFFYLKNIRLFFYIWKICHAFVTSCLL